MDKFDEYKFIASSTQLLTAQRQQASQLYLGVNTAVLAVFGVLLKDGGLQRWSLFGAITPLIVVGLAVSIVWRKSLREYRSLIAWRFSQLVALEASADLSGCYQLYTREWDAHHSTGHRQPGFRFSQFESALPWLFIVLYVCYFVGFFVGISFLK